MCEEESLGDQRKLTFKSIKVALYGHVFNFVGKFGFVGKALRYRRLKYFLVIILCAGGEMVRRKFYIKKNGKVKPIRPNDRLSTVISKLKAASPSKHAMLRQELLAKNSRLTDELLTKLIVADFVKTGKIAIKS